MESLLVIIAIMVAVAVGGALVLHFVGQLPPDIAPLVRIGVIALIVIVLMILLWRLVVRSGVAMELVNLALPVLT